MCETLMEMSKPKSSSGSLTATGKGYIWPAMGLLTIIKKQKAKDHEIRILMLGLDNSGKTTIVTSILGLPVSEVSPTMGFQINTIPYKDYNLNIWDIGGQTTLRGFWGNYFDRTDIVIWVIDCLSLERLEESFSELRQKVVEQDRLVGIKLLILVNKIDMYNEIEEAEKVVDTIKGMINSDIRLSRSANWDIMPVSGKTGYGVSAVLEWIVLQGQ